MKAMKKIVIGILAVAMLAGCKKSFLDQKPYTGVPFSDAVKDEASMQAATTGIYAGMRSSASFCRAMPLIGDLLADNVFISTQNSGRYTSFHNINYTISNGDAQSLFQDLYAIILRTNTVINSNITATANVNQLRGEALTARALCYFSLVQWFAQPYTVNPAADGVPLILQYDPNLKPARATVQEVYNQIESDLNDAYGLMTISRNSGFITKYVAKSMLCRMYQAKGDWPKCRDAALDVLNNSGYSLVPGSSLVSYWANPATRTDKVETLFEISEDAVANLGTTSLAYIYAQAGYGDALCTDDLYNQYTATDYRRSLITSAVRAGQNVKVNNKLSNASNTDEDNVKIIRMSEILLNLAEAYYHIPDETNARLRLNQLAQGRDPSFAGYSSTGATLLDDILKERRKELAFEGFRYYDLQRTQRDVVRVNLNNNYAAGVPLTLPVGNFRRILPIPQAELDANINIAKNPGYN